MFKLARQFPSRTHHCRLQLTESGEALAPRNLLLEVAELVDTEVGDVWSALEYLVDAVLLAKDEAGFRETVADVGEGPAHPVLPPRQLLSRERLGQRPRRLVVLHTKQRLQGGTFERVR